MFFRKIVGAAAGVICAAASVCIMTICADAAEPCEFSHESGTYSGTQLVFINNEEGAEVFYTTDGTTPDLYSDIFDGAPIVADRSMTVKASAFVDGELTDVQSVTLKIRTAPAVASHDGGTYGDTIKVKLACADSDAVIYYTTDGSKPDSDSKVYKKAIKIAEDTTLRYVTYSDGCMRSEISTEKYVISDEVYKDKHRQALFELVNKTRAEYGLAPVEELPALSEIAQQRAQECSCYFSHWRPDGTKWDSLLSYSGLKRNVRAENIAYYYTSAKKAMGFWLDSYYHRENILNPDARYVGLGCYDNGNTLYWCQIFIGEE